MEPLSHIDCEACATIRARVTDLERAVKYESDVAQQAMQTIEVERAEASRLRAAAQDLLDVSGTDGNGDCQSCCAPILDWSHKPIPGAKHRDDCAWVALRAALAPAPAKDGEAP